MKIIDISLPISNDLITWPGDPPIKITRASGFELGDQAQVSRIDFGVHSGTHIDAPSHFLENGSGVDELDLNTLIGPCLVVEVKSAPIINETILKTLNIPAGTERLLIKTKNSALWSSEHSFKQDFAAISSEGARWIVQNGLKLVGIDYLSIAPFNDSEEPHKILLSARIIPVEGLNLARVAPGNYHLICLPLKLNTDGAPARVVLIQ